MVKKDMLATALTWLKQPRNTLFVLLLASLTVASLALTREKAGTGAPVQEARVVHFFYLPTCHECDEQEGILKALPRNAVSVVYHDITDASEASFFSESAKSAGLSGAEMGVPAIFSGNDLFVGLTPAESILSGSSTTARKEIRQFKVPFFGTFFSDSYSLPALAVIMGLVDGINPCAMWVLVYLIGLVSGLNNRKLTVLIVGIFVAASGILYFLFMSAWLNVFLIAGSIRILKSLTGAFAFASGLFALAGLIKTRGAPVCKVGDAGQKKKLMADMREAIARPFSVALVLGIVTLAFVVNSIEFLCSSALPAVFTGVLTERQLPLLAYYAYIALYTFFFMLDDLVIFSLAVFAVSKAQDSRYAAVSSWLGCGIMTTLGLVLLFFPQVL